MQDVDTIKGEAVMALAVRVGAARLIDNYVFGEAAEYLIVRNHEI